MTLAQLKELVKAGPGKNVLIKNITRFEKLCLLS
jgi:hypothetical protein